VAPHEEAAVADTSASVLVIDIAPLMTGHRGPSDVPGQIARTCRASGFFYVVEHGVDEGLPRALEDLSRRFFAQEERKFAIRMQLGGKAWRGYFPVGGELTSGRPDLKEGIYFGAELGDAHPKVRAGTPLHGSNLFPAEIPGFRETVLAYMDALTRLLGRYVTEHRIGLAVVSSHARHGSTRTTIWRSLN
jgi:isopenicillin N synthase-like dioxygenase